MTQTTDQGTELSTESTTESTTELQSIEERELEAFGRFLDSSIRLPGGFRIGWDGVIGLIPGVGDAVGFGLSAWLVWRARQLGLPGGVVLRMLVNVAIETVVGAVPVVGDLFDFVFKANNRNVVLMQESLRQQRLATTADSVDQI